MDTIIALLLQVILFGVLAAYVALIVAAVAAAGWLAYRILHDHVTITQAFHEAGDRMRGVAPH